MLESKDDFEKQALDVSNDASYITFDFSSAQK